MIKTVHFHFIFESLSWAGTLSHAGNQRALPLRGAHHCKISCYFLFGDTDGFLWLDDRISLVERTINNLWYFAFKLYQFRRPRFGTGNGAMDMRAQQYRMTPHCDVTAILILYGLPR